MQTYNKVNEVLNILLKMKLNNDVALTDILLPHILNEIAINLTIEFNRSSQELVTEFNDAFQVEREETNQVEDFKTSNLRVGLILEETIELSFALGFPPVDLYNLFIAKRNKVYSSSPFIDNGRKLTETFDALIDLLYVTYGALDVFNLSSITEEGMVEVHSSNMSKVCKDVDILKRTVEKYRKDNINLRTIELTDGTYIVQDTYTKKVLKSIDYTPANLKQILIKHKTI